MGPKIKATTLLYRIYAFRIVIKFKAKKSISIRASIFKVKAVNQIGLCDAVAVWLLSTLEKYGEKERTL